MDTFKYMCNKESIIPEDIMQQYQLADNIHNVFVYMETRKGTYGLPQSGIISHTQLKEHLSPFVQKRVDTHQVYGRMKLDILNSF